jgi:hypothetical protein
MNTPRYRGCWDLPCPWVSATGYPMGSNQNKIKSKSLFLFSSHFNSGLYDARYINIKATDTHSLRVT